MPNDILLYLGAVLPIFWGVAHLFPTKSVITGFGEISEDNKQILKMEWINEALTLNFIGVLVIISTIIGGSKAIVSQLIYLTSAIMLFSMALVSLMTGARASQIPFKLCPIIFGIAAIMILLGGFL